MQQAVRIGVYGASGSGKTTKANELIKNLDRVIVFDPVENFPDDNMITVHSVAELYVTLRNVWKTGFRIRYVPYMGAVAVKDLHDLSVALLNLQMNVKGNINGAHITLVVDEMNTAYPVSAMKKEHWGFGEICSRGRHYRINVIGISQRMAEVNNQFRGNMTACYLFRNAHQNDRKAAESLIGSEYKEKLRSQPNFKYIYYQNGRIKTGETKK
jgi:ABC-type dipeptide/oligopeptide/nickel transport system ATPase component